jgi:hypothetical protein
VLRSLYGKSRSDLLAFFRALLETENTVIESAEAGVRPKPFDKGVTSTGIALAIVLHDSVNQVNCHRKCRISGIA